MKVSRRWIEWAHGPGAEDGQPLAMSLCDLASAPGVGAIEVADLALIAELTIISAQSRHESRGLHCNLDYPRTLPDSEVRDTILSPGRIQPFS